MNKLLIFSLCIIMIMSIGMVSAISSLSPVKQNECITLPQTEFNSNLQTIKAIAYPNKTIVLQDVNMTKNGFDYYYTFCNTTELGVYTVNGCSDISCWGYPFSVTPSGDSDLSNTSLSFVLILIIFSVMFMVIGYSIDNDKWLLKTVLYITALLIMILNIALGLQLSQSANISSLMTTALIVGTSAFAILIVYMFIIYLINIVRAIKNKRMQKDDGLL